jgi:tetratricopeptide (TPR) repeat protein
VSSARWALCWALLCGCGSPPPASYSSESERAHAARRGGDHLIAARHYERAAQAASKQRDADEAHYRAADAYARAGAREQAAAIYRELAARGDAQRRARADFALADLQLDAGNEQGGQSLLAEAIRRHPNSGLSRRALERHLSYLREHGGHAAVLEYLTALQDTLGRSELGEALAYRRARELDDAGRRTEARDAYLACASRFPYPKGAYWDDALYRAAEQELALGAPTEALGHLQRLLSEKEGASFVGSYQRGRYAEGQLLTARIYRDHLRDATRARRELRRVWLEHPSSRLVDDALFEEALLAHRAGDQVGTCAPLQIITSKLPDSRYAPCAHLLCGSLHSLAGRDCHAYIKREAGLP